jgi:ABC-type antimicrobial peptide transport system permease subunit
MLYVRKNLYLFLVLSLGALIFVSAMATAGSFSYFLQKRSMYIAIDESSTDVILSQDCYQFFGSLGLSEVPPDYICRTINSTASVTNTTCLVIMKLEVNTSVNLVNKGVDTILIIGLWTKEPLNFTMSQGSYPHTYYHFMVSEHFFHQYDAVIQSRVDLNSTPNGLRWSLKGYVQGVTPLTLSQLMAQLGVYDSLPFAGYDASRLAVLDQYPFVVCQIQAVFQLLEAERPPSLFFVKFAKETFANPWDIDITVGNLKQVGENLVLVVNNASSQRIGTEAQVVSIGNWPTAAILQELSGFLSINRLTVLAFGFTIAIVGWYFYSILSQAIIATKARELQLIRVRGASNKSLTRSLAFIVIIAGIVGTIFGLFLGYSFIATLTPSILGISFSTEDFSATFNMYSLLIYSSFGLATSLLSQRKVFSQTSSIKPQNEHQKSPTETGKSLSATIGLLVAFGLGALKAVSWIFGVKISLEGQSTNPVTSAALLFVRLLDRTILDTLGPILLIYALVNIVSMKPTVLSTVSYAISRTLSSHLATLSRKIMHEKSVKMVGGMIITSLLVFNVVSVQMGHAGIETAWARLSIAAVGADIRIDMRESVATSLFRVLNNVSGVSRYTQILGVKTAIGTPLAGTLAYVINSTEYTALVDEIDPTLASMLRSTVDMGIIASRFFHDVGVLNLGNIVKLEDRELRVVGFVENLPGTLSIPPSEKFAILDVKAVRGINYTIVCRTVIIDTGGRPPQDVMDDIALKLPEPLNHSYTVATRSSVIAQFSHGMAISMIVKNVMSLLMVASLVSVVFAIAAIAVMAYNEAKDRRPLDVLLRIKGVTRRQLLTMALSGAFTLVLFALIIGLFAGYVMASGYTAYYSLAFPVNASPTVSYGLVTQLLALIGVYLLLSVAPSMFAATKTARVHAH